MIQITYNWNDEIITEDFKSQKAATKRVQEIYENWKNQDWFYLHKEILKHESRVDDKKKNTKPQKQIRYHLEYLKSERADFIKLFGLKQPKPLSLNIIHK